ncbi:hypothetical protein ACUUL3_16475 [Thiovibrio sp. JS02]
MLARQKGKRYNQRKMGKKEQTKKKERVLAGIAMTGVGLGLAVIGLRALRLAAAGFLLCAGRLRGRKKDRENPARPENRKRPEPG